MTTTEDKIARDMAREIQHKPDAMELVLQPQSALQLAGVVQLALRHPGIADHTASRDAALRFLSGVRQYFADCPTVLEVLRRGDDPAEDR
jgi:hypothetical protein